MNRIRTLGPYLWAVPIVVSAWHMGRLVANEELFRGIEGAILLSIITGYTITLVACSRRPFTGHQVGHALAFIAAAFLGVLCSNIERDLGMIYFIYFSLALAFWAFLIAGVGALVLALTSWIVSRRPAARG
jgi:hypothetical protein